MPGAGLQVVIPQGFDRRKIPGIVHENRSWIQKAFGKQKDQGCLCQPSLVLPDSIDLKAIGKCFEVSYSSQSSEPTRLVHSEGLRLQIIGDTNDSEACRKLLRRWLGQQGKIHLIPWLQRLSDQTGLQFSKGQIRGQISRWGSCSGKGTISLNFKLLFLPSELVHYILIHELCHTVNLNHSPDFWAFVAKLEPGYKSLDVRMGRASELVPLWVH